MKSNRHKAKGIRHKRLRTYAFALVTLLPLPFCLVPSSPASPPNFLIVLCDDLGYGDLACYGDPVLKTPNVDRFAAESLKLTSCYAAAANCSPARTGLMTGRTPYRVGIHDWIPMLSPMHVKREEITIATLLRDAGYDTCHSGKWHLNGRFNLPGQPQPGDHGFNHWFSTQNNALPDHRNPDNFVRNGVPAGQLEGFSADLVAGEAIHWLEDLRDRSAPFFLYVCFHEPHEPIASAPEYTEIYRDIAKGNESCMQHHGNITQMDAAFGELMKAVDDLGLRKDTFVFFTSDNGPAITGRHPHGSSGPLRDKKGSLYEGGIRVPGIVRWPGHTKAGTVDDAPVCGVDVLPTLCEIAGIEKPAGRKLDGASFVPAISGGSIERSTPLYWHYLRAHNPEAKVAMRDGPWKIIAGLDQNQLLQGAGITKEQMTMLKTAELKGFQLYNLEDDIGESNDLAAAQPERLAALEKRLIAKYREVREESPVWPDWEWPRYESQRIRVPSYKGKKL